MQPQNNFFQKQYQNIISKIPEKTKADFILKSWGIFKIPLIAYVWPSIVDIDDRKSILSIPLNYRTKNHLGVMYFGALAVGAEVTIAMHAVSQIVKSNKKVDFVFSTFKADFHKKAKGDVHFICEQGEDVKNLTLKTIQTKERESATFKSYAIVPSIDPNDKIAEFELTLSMKCKG